MKLGILATEKVQAFVLGTNVKCIKIKVGGSFIDLCYFFDTTQHFNGCLCKISAQDLEILGAVLRDDDKAVMPNDLINPQFVKFHLHGFLSPPNCSKKFVPHA